MLLEYLDVNYEMVYYEQGDGPEFSRDDWLDKKWKIGLAFPNLPYLIQGNFSLTETSAMMKYLCERHKPELLGKTPEERGLSFMIENILMEV